MILESLCPAEQRGALTELCGSQPVVLGRLRSNDLPGSSKGVDLEIYERHGAFVLSDPLVLPNQFPSRRVVCHHLLSTPHSATSGALHSRLPDLPE